MLPAPEGMRLSFTDIQKGNGLEGKALSLLSDT